MLARVALSPNHQGHHAAQPFSRHFQDRARRVVTVCTGVVEDASTSAVSFAPARVRVQHEALIRASRAAVWEVLQKLTPPDQWKDVSVVLATLESIYGVEYQGLAEQLLTAFQEANKQQSLLDRSGDRSGSNSGIVDETLVPGWLQAPQLGQLIQSWLGQQQQQQEQPAAPAAEASTDEKVGSATTGSSSSSSSSTANDKEGSGSSAASPEQPLARAEASAAAATTVADETFMQLLLLLAYKAKFVSLSERDVQLGVSLNTEFLWQLFVKVNTQQLDKQLVAPYISGSTTNALSSSSSHGHHAGRSGRSVLRDLDSLLVLRRGYGSEMQRGRWLFQKIDYVQLLLVKKAIKGIADLNSRLMLRAKAAVGVLTHRQQPRQQQQHQVQEEDQQTGLGTIGLSQEPPSSQPDSSDWHHPAELSGSSSTSPQLTDEVRQRCGRVPSEQLLMKQKIWQEQQQVKEQRRQQARQQQQLLRQQKQQRRLQQPAASSQQVVPSSSQHQGQAASGTTEDDQLANAAAALAAVAASPQLRSWSDVELADSCQGMNQQSTNSKPPPPPLPGAAERDAQTADDDQIPTGPSDLLPSPPSTRSTGNPRQGREGATGDVEAMALLPQLPPERRRRQLGSRGSGVVYRLTTRLQQSINRTAHSLSDWGIIPRFDVIPLEVFDQVFPLTEPPRFKPIFIEKATLPDILDPVIQPRLQWLAGNRPAAGNSPAAGSSDGSSNALTTPTPHAAAAAAADNDDRSTGELEGQAGGGSPPVVWSFWQPIDLVTPTFLQMLVVYRKKPRPDRWHQWRVLRHRLLGRPQQQQQQEAAAAAGAGVRRGSSIQLQVYRDIPLPSWQMVFPDKLLQFRPLDLLRLDLFGVFGVGAALFQARYNNIYLELLALASLTVWGTRLVLGYRRMGDRYKSIVAQLLAERTVAGGEGALEYLATAAGLQQFKQTALAYVLLLEAGQALEVEELAAAAEKVLQEQLQVQLRFDAAEALSELNRFGLLDEVQGGSSSSSSSSNGKGNMLTAAATTAAAAALDWQGRAGTGSDSDPENSLDIQAGAVGGKAAGGSLLEVEEQRQLMPEVVAKVAQNGSNGHHSEQQQQQQQFLYSVCGSRPAQQVLQQYWASLLQQRVDSILRAQDRE